MDIKWRLPLWQKPQTDIDIPNTTTSRSVPEDSHKIYLEVFDMLRRFLPDDGEARNFLNNLTPNQISAVVEHLKQAAVEDCGAIKDRLAEISKEGSVSAALNNLITQISQIIEMKSRIHTLESTAKNQAQVENYTAAIDDLAQAIELAKDFAPAQTNRLEIKLAHIYAKNGNLNEAIKIYIDVLARLKTSNVEKNQDIIIALQQQLARFYQVNNQPEEALAMWLKILNYHRHSLQPDFTAMANTLFLLVDIYIDLELYMSARWLCEDMLTLVKSKADGNHQNIIDKINEKLNTLTSHLADFAKANGRYPQAEAYYLQLLAKFASSNKDTTEINTKLDSLYTKWSHNTTDITVLLRILEFFTNRHAADNENSLQIIQKLANLYSGQGKFDEAIKLLKKTLPHLAPLHPNRFSFTQQLVKLYLNNNKFTSAFAIWRSYISQLATSASIPDNFVDFTIELANNLAQNSHIDSAIQLLETLQHIQPNNVTLMFGLTSLYKQKQDDNRVIANLKSLLQILDVNHPDKLSYTQQLVKLFLKGKQFTEAKEVWNNYLSGLTGISNDIIDFTLQIVNHLVENSYMDNAIELLEQANQQQPTNSNVIARLIGLYQTNQDYNKAIELINKVRQDTKILPEYPSSLSEKLVELHIQAKQYSDAEEIQLAIIESFATKYGEYAPETIAAMLKIVDIYLLQEDYSGATETLLLLLRHTKNQSEVIIASISLAEKITSQYPEKAKGILELVLQADAQSYLNKYNTTQVVKMLATAVSELASSHKKNSAYGQAIQVLKRFITSAIQALNNNKHPLVVKYRKQLINLLQEYAPYAETLPLDTKSLLEQALEHCKELVGNEGKLIEVKIRLQLTTHALAEKDWGRAEELLNNILAYLNKNSNSDIDRTLLIANIKTLADVYAADPTKHKVAEDLYQKIIKYHTGEDNEMSVAAKLYLARLWMQGRRKYDDAITYYWNVIQYYQQPPFPEDYLPLLEIKNEFAAECFQYGNYRTPGIILPQIIPPLKNLVEKGTGIIVYLNALNNLATLYATTKQQGYIEDLSQRLVDIANLVFKRPMGFPQDVMMALKHVIKNIICVLTNNNAFDKCRACFDYIIKKVRSVNDTHKLNVKDISVVAFLINSFMVSANRYMNANAMDMLDEDTWKYLIETFTLPGLMEDSFVITLMTTYAYTRFGLGKYKDAIEIYMKVLSHHEKTLGLDHRDTIGILYALAQCYQKNARAELALLYYQKAYEGIKGQSVFGEKEPLPSHIKYAYAKLLIEQQKKDENIGITPAEGTSLILELLQSAKSWYSANMPDSEYNANAMIDFANYRCSMATPIFSKNKKLSQDERDMIQQIHDDSLAAATKALEIAVKLGGRALQIKCFMAIADAYILADKNDKTIKYYQKALDMLPLNSDEERARLQGLINNLKVK